MSEYWRESPWSGFDERDNQPSKKKKGEVMNTDTKIANRIFAKRINDQSKCSLAYTFIKDIRHTAFVNDLNEDVVWAKWQNYSKQCGYMDQSAIYSEFLRWNNFGGDL